MYDFVGKVVEYFEGASVYDSVDVRSSLVASLDVVCVGGLVW